MGFQNSNNPFNELEVFATSWHDYISDRIIQESYFSNHYSLISSAALSCLPISYRIAGERSETA